MSGTNYKLNQAIEDIYSILGEHNVALERLRERHDLLQRCLIATVVVSALAFVALVVWR